MTNGSLGFIVGAVLAQIVYGLGLGVPALLAVLLAERTGGSPALAVAFAGLFGAALSFFVGMAFGYRPELNWWFVAGAVFAPAFMLLRLAVGPREGVDAFVIVTVASYGAAGLALAAGFYVGRSRRAGLRRPAKQAHPADGQTVD